MPSYVPRGEARVMMKGTGNAEKRASWTMKVAVIGYKWAEDDVTSSESKTH